MTKKNPKKLNARTKRVKDSRVEEVLLKIKKTLLLGSNSLKNIAGSSLVTLDQARLALEILRLRGVVVRSQMSIDPKKETWRLFRKGMTRKGDR